MTYDGSTENAQFILFLKEKLWKAQYRFLYTFSHIFYVFLKTQNN
jgi:hypothetical protein